MSTAKNHSPKFNAPFAEPLVLRSRPIKWLGYLLINLVFFAIGIWMIRTGETRGWWLVLIFGFGAVVCATPFFPSSSYLKLSQEGLTMVSLFRKHFVPWAHFQKFFVARVPLQKMVVFRLSDLSSSSKFLRGLSTDLAGCEGGLPDTYGLSAEDLAKVLNRWREAHSQDGMTDKQSCPPAN